jgi:hypothetical protein
MNIFNAFIHGGSPKKQNKINFEDMQKIIKNPDQYIVINTLSEKEQACLIQNTISIEKEEKMINAFLENYEMKIQKIVVYGKNAGDPNVEKKYQQLVSLGFSDIYIYSGGMFEWMLLQDIYGAREFPSTSKELDILKFRGERGL